MEDDTVTLTRAEYDALLDARDHAQAMRDVATGAMDILSEVELEAYLSAATPLAFWRGHRGLSMATLAGVAGVSPQALADMEQGMPGGDVILYAKLARALHVRIEDLLPPE